MHSILIIGKVWPEEKTTGAGVRMLQIIRTLSSANYNITFASTAQIGAHSTNLNQWGVTTAQIQLNSYSFNVFLQTLQPEIVLFDRFSTEEQFGWRVEEELPNSLRVLDTEDLHFLRAAREETLKKEGFPYSLEKTINEACELDITFREIASMLRCDVNFIISSFEMDLLKHYFPVPESQLHYLPLLPSEGDFIPSFHDREHFIFAGNFFHQPNKDAVHFLQKLWPSIKQELPEAELFIYGAYANETTLQLNNPKNGFHIRGWVEDLSAEMAKSRILIAPLRYGAGLKSKILEAFRVGTPVATTEIGAEGIAKDGTFGGVIGNGDETWRKDLVALYRNELLWKEAQDKSLTILSNNFHGKELEELPDFIHAKLTDVLPTRKTQFLQKLMHHETMRSSKYLSKWIMEKNKA